MIEVYKVKNSYKVFICIWIIILLFFVIYFGYKMTSDNNQVSIQEKQVKQEVRKMSE
ncbi:amino acid permease [Bacillus sp. RC97]